MAKALVDGDCWQELPNEIVANKKRIKAVSVTPHKAVSLRLGKLDKSRKGGATKINERQASSSTLDSESPMALS